MDRIILNALFRYAPLIINNCRCIFIAQRLFHRYIASAVLPISLKGFGFSQQVLRLSALTIFGENRAVYRQIICLLSMIITESEHTVFVKTCLCLYIGYACCQRKNKFSLDSFSERKNFHFSLKHCVRTYHKASDFSFS